MGCSSTPGELFFYPITPNIQKNDRKRTVPFRSIFYLKIVQKRTKFPNKWSKSRKWLKKNRPLSVKIEKNDRKRTVPFRSFFVWCCYFPLPPQLGQVIWLEPAGVFSLLCPLIDYKWCLWPIFLLNIPFLGGFWVFNRDYLTKNY